MTVFDDAVNGYAELSKEFKGKSPNLKRCGEVLNQLKICLVQLSFLPNDKEAHTKVGSKLTSRKYISYMTYFRNLSLQEILSKWVPSIQLHPVTFLHSADILPSSNRTISIIKIYQSHISDRSY